MLIRKYDKIFEITNSKQHFYIRVEFIQKKTNFTYITKLLQNISNKFGSIMNNSLKFIRLTSDYVESICNSMQQKKE